MSGLYKDNILPSNPNWNPDWYGTGSYSNKDVERWYCHSRCWPNCIESHDWIVGLMKNLLRENFDYKPEYFSQDEIDGIRKKICF